MGFDSYEVANKLSYMGAPNDIAQMAMQVVDDITNNKRFYEKGLNYWTGDQRYTIDITKYPQSVYAKLVNMIKSYGLNSNAMSYFKSSEINKGGNPGFDSYAKAISKINTPKWTFNASTGLPYPAEGMFNINNKESDIQGNADTNALKQYSSGRMLTNTLGFNTGDYKQYSETIGNVTATQLNNPSSAVSTLEPLLKQYYSTINMNQNNDALVDKINEALDVVQNNCAGNAQFGRLFCESALRAKGYVLQWLRETGNSTINSYLNTDTGV